MVERDLPPSSQTRIKISDPFFHARRQGWREPFLHVGALGMFQGGGSLYYVA